MDADERQQRRAADWEKPLPAPWPAPQAEGPRWVNSCTACVFLGRFEASDLYFCPRNSVREAMLGIRTGPGAEEILFPAEPVTKHPPLAEARRRAIAAGLVAEPAKPAESPAEDPAWRAEQIRNEAMTLAVDLGEDWSLIQSRDESERQHLYTAENRLLRAGHILPRPKPPKPAPVPAVIETPEEVVERVANDHMQRRYDFKTTMAEDLHAFQQDIIKAFSAQSAAHAAQLAQVRRDILCELQTHLMNAGHSRAADFVRELNVSAVAAGGGK